MEFLLTIGVVCLVICAVKLLFSLILLPFRLVGWLLHGVFGLLICIPLLILGIGAFSLAFPVVVLLCLLPAILLVAGLAALIKLLS